ncbi:hypothetical protein Tco_1506767 [Tanacetum coccineum]
MDKPVITMEEYIQIEAEKARRRGQEFNWETATYGKVRYFEDIDYFKDFKNELPAIVYKDVVASKPEVSSKPTVSAHHAKKVDFDFVISFFESDDENYTFTYDKNLFFYKLVSVNDLKSDSDNNDNKINIKISLEDVPIESSNDVDEINVNTYSNAFDKNILRDTCALDTKGQEYTDTIIQDFKERLGRIFGRQVNRLQVLDFGALTEEIDQAITDRLRMDHTEGDGQTGISSSGDFLTMVSSYTAIREPLRKWCHRLIAFTIAGKGQAPEKYLFRHAEGRKQGARISGGYFVARLAEHFGLIIEKSLRGLTVVVRDLTMIDMDELVRLHICERLGDVWAWVVPGPESQTIPHRLQRLEEEVCGLRESFREQRLVVDTLSKDFLRNNAERKKDAQGWSEAEEWSNLKTSL